MIAKAFLSIIKGLTDFIFGLLPEFPVIPSFIVNLLTSMTNIMINGAKVIKYLLGPLIYNALLDYIVVLFGIKIFFALFKFIKKWVLLK